jgi:hypothetical protein
LKVDRRRLAWLSGVLAALASVMPARAQEPPLPCAGRSASACVPSPALPIPANGAITVAAQPGKAVTMYVSDDQYVEVPGSFVMIAHGTWAWHAAGSPVPGFYNVQVTDELGSSDYVTIEFLEAAPRTWPELTSAASLSQVIANEAPSCCTLDTGAGVIDFNCVTLAETTYAVLHPGLSSASSPVELNQYVFRYSAPDHSSDVMVLPWTTPAALPIYTMSEEYCYEVDAIDLVTGTIHPYRDLPARCAPHGMLAPIESTVKQLADDALASTSCPMPPDGFTDRWCELNAEACLVGVPPRHCHFYPFTCENQPYPGAGWRDARPRDRGPLTGLRDLVDEINQRTSGGGADPEGSADDVGDAGRADAASEHDDIGGAGGCTVRTTERADMSPMLLGLCAACAWRAFRRRSPRGRA